MAQASPALIDVDKIDIEEGFNARTQIDPDALERMVGTVEEAGVVQAIRVRPKDENRFWLVAGERRLRAARKAQVKTIPGIIHRGTHAEAVRDSLLENLHREELNEVDQARGIKMLAEEWDLRTNVEIA
ncbi:MAG: ParB/RepB/Spo0J family partition protein, partial [Actinobacteria bacterium]|nr:ParB/RepB/Spo0J family partition protein [Actinomycetota bacterium]